MTTRLTLTRPDDWHLHLRDGAALAAVLPATARAVRACHRDAQPAPAGHHGRGGRWPTASASSPRCPPGSDFSR